MFDLDILKVVFSTSIPLVEAANSFSVYVDNNVIYVYRHVEGAPSLGILYNSMGQQLSVETIADKAQFTIPRPGIYLLKIDHETHKILVP